MGPDHHIGVVAHGGHIVEAAHGHPVVGEFLGEFLELCDGGGAGGPFRAHPITGKHSVERVEELLAVLAAALVFFCRRVLLAAVPVCRPVTVRPVRPVPAVGVGVASGRAVRMCVVVGFL